MYKFTHKFVFSCFVLSSLVFTFNSNGQKINVLTDKEIEDGWSLLFDGTSTEHWRSADKPDFPEKGWQVEDGVLTILGIGGGDIITVAQYADFELSLEFRLTPGANSGIKYVVQTGTSLGLEYQLLDDERHPDAKEGVGGNRTLASLYDLIPAENKKVRTIGEWNHARIVVQGKHVEHWLNGEKVVEYERATQMYRALIAKSKYKDITNFGEFSKGHILLQDHGNVVSFRNIKIRVN